MKREHWMCDVGGDSVAVLNVPAALHRSRTFDIDVSLEVKVVPTEPQSWHELVFEIDQVGASGAGASTATARPMDWITTADLPWCRSRSCGCVPSPRPRGRAFTGW